MFKNYYFSIALTSLFAQFINATQDSCSSGDYSDESTEYSDEDEEEFILIHPPTYRKKNQTCHHEQVRRERDETDETNESDNSTHGDTEQESNILHNVNNNMGAISNAANDSPEIQGTPTLNVCGSSATAASQK